MKRLHTLAELRSTLSAYRHPAVVPTMGNLHAGHMALVKAAKPLGDVTVATVFVNRLQFGPKEDFATYPRTLEADCAQLEAAGCDIVFAPSEAELYPEPQSFLIQPPPELANILEGAFRPGFFTGVATVVMKLLSCTQARTAVFGKKDYQQLMVIRQMVKQFKGQTPGPADWDKVVNEVIKMSFGDLGLGVAIRWGLPDALVFSMRRYPLTAEPNPPREPAERMRLLASAAHELVEVMQSGDEHQLSTAIDQIAQRYDKAMGLTPKQLGAAVAGSRARMQELVKALRIPVRAGSVASHWMDHASDFVPLAPESDAATQALALPDGAQDLSMHAYPQATKPIDVLSAGISDVINSMVEDDFKLNAVIRVALETMYRAFKFERVVFCLRNPKAGKLVGKIALGTDAQYMPERFQIDLVKVLQPQADLFTAVCHKGLDTLISDANVPSLALRLPQWYCNGVNAPTFLLLPLRHKDITIGLIYADKPEAGTITLSDREFSQLGTLRSQLVMAFRQATQGSAPKAA